jgi:putative MATE family efflux protein
VSWRHRDHTRGSLVASIGVLAIPTMASSLTGGVVFQLVDLTFLSRLGEAPMASVIIVNQSLRQILFMLVMGASFGTQALVARSVGEGRTDAAEHVAGQSVLLGALFALAVAAMGGLFPEALFSLPGPDSSFYAYGVPYLRLTFLFGFGLVGTLLFTGILAGAGDTTMPLVVTLLQVVVALCAEWVLIFGHLGAPALGVRGAALGVALGQTVALGLALMVLFRGASRVHLRARHLRPDPAAMRRIVALSWPPALQLLGGLITNIWFLRLTGEFGASVQKAFAIGLRLGMIVPAVCFPIASACATLVGQALGAGDVRRAWRAVGVSLLVHGSVMWSFALGVFWFREPIVAFFSDDPEVVRIGAEYLLYASGAFALWAFFFVFMRTLQGAGEVIPPMLISLGNTLLVTLPLSAYLARATSLGPSGIWIAFLASSVVSTLGTGLWLATGRWARPRAHSLPLPEE